MTVPDKRPFYWQVWNFNLNGSPQFQPIATLHLLLVKGKFSHLSWDLLRNARNGPWRHWNVSKVMRVLLLDLLGCWDMHFNRSVFFFFRALKPLKLRLRDGCWLDGNYLPKPLPGPWKMTPRIIFPWFWYNQVFQLCGFIAAAASSFNGWNPTENC